MSLYGLPDFQPFFLEQQHSIYRSYRRQSYYYTIPNGLRIAERTGGGPDFLLEFVHGTTPLLPPKPYGVLSFRIVMTCRLDDALQELRTYNPQARLAPAFFTSGFLRFTPAVSDLEIPEELIKPAPITWNGIGIAKHVIRLSEEATNFIKKSLAGELLLINATAEMEIDGVVPRLPIHISFDPAELLGSLLDFCGGGTTNQAALDKVIEYFQDIDELPLRIEGELIELTERNLFAQIMVDRIRTRFGSFIPSPGNEDKPYVLLKSPDEVGHGRFDWDLSEAVKVSRSVILKLNPFDAAHDIVRQHGLQAVTKTVRVPNMPTGVLPISVSANLPADRLGVLETGVRITAPAQPPHRVQMLEEVVRFSPPDDASNTFLLFSPREKQEYQFQTFMILHDSGGVRQLEGDSVTHSGTVLSLRPVDFPVNFVLLEASEALLEIATVQCIAEWLETGRERYVTFELNTDRPSTAVPFTKNAEDSFFKINIQSLEDQSVISLDRFPADDLLLGLHSLVEYGSHTVEIECVFTGDSATVPVEFASEEDLDSDEHINFLFFTPEKSVRSFSYLTTSPFRSGYCYRVYKPPGESQDQWSEVQSPFKKLLLEAEILQER